MKNRVATTGAAIAILWMTMGQAAPPPAVKPSSIPPAQSKSAETAETGLLAKEQATSKERMRQIYDAIQAYRKDHKELPDYLSDLYPQYIADTNVFLCPAMSPGEELPFPELHDPKLLVQFGYEFNVHPIQAMFGYTGPMTMRAWKRMQMSVVGGVVPILRCFAFDQVINVGFDGQVYESPVDWEDNFTDLVKPGELEPLYLRLLMLRNLGVESNGDALAFEQLQEAVSRNNRGVVVSDKPLSDKYKKWNQEVAHASLAVADQARKFLTDFPQSKDAGHAGRIEEQMLLKATAAGSSEADRRLEAMLTEKLKAPGLSEDERFELRSLQVQAAKARMNGQPQSVQLAAYERNERSLIREFPRRPEPYLMLLSSAREMPPAQARATIDELLQSTNAPKAIKLQAEGVLRGMNVVGHPLDIQFSALDGRQVDTSKLKGKVVLIDFWATWCGPCVAEVPHVKEAYDKFHDKGFEVIGISFDSDKEALEKFVKSKDLPWPQYFDGKGWQNQFGKEYGIEAIPTMWLISREGKVVDTNARSDLAGKIGRLIAQD